MEYAVLQSDDHRLVVEVTELREHPRLGLYRLDHGAEVPQLARPVNLRHLLLGSGLGLHFFHYALGGAVCLAERGGPPSDLRIEVQPALVVGEIQQLIAERFSEASPVCDVAPAFGCCLLWVLPAVLAGDMDERADAGPAYRVKAGDD